MTTPRKRGRKLLATAPTRTAVYQRNYRAQRARYVVNLEEHIHRLEEENAQLRVDLEAARASQTAPPQIPPECLNDLLFSVMLRPDVPRPHTP